MSAAFADVVSSLPPGRVLQTGPLMSALLRADFHSDWPRIRPAHLANPSQFLDQGIDGRRNTSGATWGGVPLSGDLYEALVRVEVLVSHYRKFGAVEPGLLALALVADDRTGTSQQPRRGTGHNRQKLIEIVQSDVLRAELPGVARLLSGAVPPLPPDAPILVMPAATP